MLLDRKKLVETSYFFIADIVEGLDTSLAYSRGGFIPNLKNFNDLQGKHSEEQTGLGGEHTSDIWEEQWSKFWESLSMLKDWDAMVNEPFEERLQTALEENKKLDAFKSKVRRKENEESFLRPEESFRGYKPIHFYRFKIPEIDLENTATVADIEVIDNFPFSQQLFDSLKTLEYEIIAEEDLGFELYQWLYEMELNQLVSFTFSIHGFYTNLKNYYEQNKGLSFWNT